MPPTRDQAELLDRFYGALSAKNLEAARACCAPDVRFWHNFDDVEQDLDQASRGWQGLFAAFAENRVDAVRRDAIPGGLLQRHRFLLRGPDGVLKAKPCCIVVTFAGGLIARLEEYIDLANSLVVAEQE